jgi:hypothetical protein
MMDPAEAAQALTDHEAWLHDRMPHDLGDGIHRWGWWNIDDHGISLRWLMWGHVCTTGRLVAEDPLHIEASILCRACGDHGWIRDGVWVPT